ncbi:MAG: hypothetical protein KIS86_06980 [Devosia sp.]|nr:hypothetical protein [Devosia sp.]
MRKFGALFALTLLALPGSAMAQSGAECAAIAADAERLACYDGVFRSEGAPVSALSVSVESEQLIPARPSGRAPATITIACDTGVLSIAFSFAGNTLSALGRDAGITLQNDLQQARSRTLPVNLDNTAVVIATTRDALAFLDTLPGTSNLTARLTPANSRSLSVRFNAPAILEAAAPVRAACS